MKFALKSWRRKDKSLETSSPPSPSVIEKNSKPNLTLLQVQTNGNRSQHIVLTPFPPSPMSFIDTDPFERGMEHRPLRQRSKSTSTLCSGKQNFPIDARHRPPANRFSGTPGGDGHETPPLSLSFEKAPRRPPRPPQYLSPSATLDELRSSDLISEPDSPTLPSPLSPTRLRSVSSSASLCRKKSRRPAPELEGVWRDFLESTGEVMDPLDFKDVPFPIIPPETTNGHALSDLPLNPAKRVVRPSAVIVSAPEPCQREAYPVDKPGVSLADMFPAPPPLNIRKRTVPAPLQLDLHSRLESQGSLPALSPGSGYPSPDLSPIATPNSPRSPQQLQRRYTHRQPPSPICLSFEDTPPPSPKVLTPLNRNCEELPQFPLRNAHSTSNLRSVPKAARKPAYHRPTSSDSSSDHSNSRKEAYKAPYGEFNYLQTRGRRPSCTQGRQTFVPQGLAL